MLDRAGKRGAVEALRAIGLEDETAGSDIREVRTLLTAWRETKRTIWQQVVKMVVTLLLAAMAAGLALLAWTQGSRP
jgi:hypothetical protein